MSESGIFIVEEKKSSMNIKSEYDVINITKENDFFIGCDVMFNEEQESINFKFDLKKLFPVVDIKQKRMSQLQFLISVSKLEKLASSFLFSLNPNNLYYDANMNVKVALRDVMGDGQKGDNEFLLQYKSLIGTILLAQYSFHDFYEGGLTLLSKNAFLTSIQEAESVEAVEQLLFDEYIKTTEQESKVVSIPKEKFKTTKIILWFLSFLSIALIVGNIYQFMFVNKVQNKELEALSYFIDSKYVETIDILENSKTSSLTNEMKYILATSYIKSSGLDEDAKKNALSQVKLTGNQAYNEFWVFLGRKEFDDAYEVANKFTDERLLYYAYSVEYASLSTNTDLSSDEKNIRKQELEKKIDEYIKKIDNSSEAQEGGK